MAKTYKGIVLEIGGDASGLNKELKKSETQTKSLQTQLNNVNKALKLDPGNVDLVRQKQRLLAEQVEQTENKLKILKSTQEEFIKSGGDVTDAGYVSLQAEIVKTEEKLKSLNGQQSGLSAGLESFANKADSTGDTLISAGKKTAAMSAAATGALTGMAMAAISFDEAWTGVKKVYQGSESDLDGIKESILSLSSATGTAAVDIASVAEAGATLGITGDDLAIFTEVMTKLGDTTSVTADQAADSLGKLMNITKTSAGEYENLASAIVNLGNKTAASEDAIIAISQRFASAGTQAGMTEADILGLSAAMAAVGIDGEAAGSSLSRTTNKINSAVSSGSKSLTTFAQTAGMTASEFKQAWEEDAGSAFEQVIIGLNKASNEGKDLTGILAEMGVTSTNDVNAMLSLATSSDVLSDSLSTANDGWTENTALAEESGTYYDSAGSKLNQLKESVVNLGIKLGEILLPFIVAVVDGIKDFVDWLSNADPTIQTIIVTVLGLIAVLSPILLVLGTLAKSVSNIIRLGGSIAKMMSTLKGIVMPIISAIKGAVVGLFKVIMANPVIAIIVAIVAIVVYLYTQCEWFRDGVHNIINSVIEFFTKLGEDIGTAIDNIAQGFSDFVTWIKELPGKIGDAINGAIEGVRQWGANLVTKAKEAAKNMVDGVVSWVQSLPSKMLSIGGDIVHGIWNGISGAAGWLADKVSGFCDGIVSSITSFFGIFSPSRLMRDEVGVYLAEGIGVGFVNQLSNVNKDITKSLGSTVSSVQDALDFESSKQVAFETMATQDLSTTMNHFKDSILSTVQEMMDGITMQHNFNVSGQTVATEITPLVDKNLASIAKRGVRQ